MPNITLKMKIALTADGARAVPFEHPQARFLLGAPGQEIPEALARQLGIKDGRIEVELPEPEVGGPPYDLRRQIPPAKDLEDYTRDELVVLAKDRGLKVKAKATKAQLVEQLDEQQGDPPPVDDDPEPQGGTDEAETGGQDDPQAAGQAEAAGTETEGEPPQPETPEV